MMFTVHFSPRVFLGAAFSGRCFVRWRVLSHNCRDFRCQTSGIEPTNVSRYVHACSTKRDQPQQEIVKPATCELTSGS